jgi:hypothetical protein
VTAAGHDDAEGCLCLVGGYAKQDALIARVAAEAQQRVMMSPMLADVLQLRFVDLGPEPGQVGDRFRPVRRITAELLAAKESAGRRHFALIVIAKSAMMIEGLLGTCAAEPFLAGLRIRYVGIASSDDRQPGTGFADIVSSPTGKWGGRELVDVLRRQCDELPRFFTVGGDPGLTRAEFAALRQAHNAGRDDGGPLDESRESDILDAADSHTGTPAPADVVPGAVVNDRDAVPTVDAAAVADPAAVARRPRLAISRLLPGLPWRGGPQPAETGPPDPTPKTTGLVYLLIVGEPDSMDDPALGSLRAALVAVDRKLAAQRVCGYRVRLVHGDDRELRGELRDAGQLSRRSARRTVKADDFCALLNGVLASLRRDGVQTEAVAKVEGQAVARPAVIIFSADPPLADRRSTAAFADLAMEAAVVWVVPANAQGLVSPAFANQPTVAVIGEHQAVADDIWDLLRASEAYAPR